MNDETNLLKSIENLNILSNLLKKKNKKMCAFYCKIL